MSPTWYRDFHFAHHRHTQDCSRDPELLADPDLLLDWPTNVRDWLVVVGGWRLLRAKLTLMRNLWFFPDRTFEQSRSWARKGTFNRMKWETRLLSLAWVSLPAGAIAAVPGFAALTCALLLSHLFQSVWLSSEHTGLPPEGGILERTRSVGTTAWIRWFLWNMNYHAEHHGWPAVPWYRLGELHGRVGEYVTSESGYVRLHGRVWRELRDAS